jgi:formylglycine-generating enzyme required for sulfatase activity
MSDCEILKQRRDHYREEIKKANDSWLKTTDVVAKVEIDKHIAYLEQQLKQVERELADCEQIGKPRTFWERINLGVAVPAVGIILACIISFASGLMPNILDILQFLTPQATLSTQPLQQTQDAITPTATHIVEQDNATATAEKDPLVLAERGVTTNAEWTPYVQNFNGVEMVLVPAGCFDMGSNDGASDEQPIEKFCFDVPFWIDRYEVSNSQFAQFDGLAAQSSHWTEANLPREQITWSEAHDFCGRRDTRLPTEAEWEYAARGSDELEYPWGNGFDGTRLNFCDNNCTHEWFDDSYDDGYENTASVGFFGNGISWVGAYQMSGNVWEWVNTIYDTDTFPYPYATDDGREDIDRTGVQRVLRGGSWYDSWDFTRAADRIFDSSLYVRDDSVGVRCARDY